MKTDDLIMVSIDDHVVEPPDMFEGRVPAKWAEFAPRVVVGENGVDQWVYRGRPTGVSGLNAVVSWPAEEWGRDPAGFDEMRPGVYDVHERVRDMSRNGILASMCFPTFTGFSALHLSHFRDETTVVMIQAYNDWHIDEWDGAYPGRFIPLAIIPTWDPALAVAEIHRVAAKGPGPSRCRNCRTSRVCPAITTCPTGVRCSKPCATPGWRCVATSARGSARSRVLPTRRSTT